MSDRDGEIGVSGSGRPMSRGEFLATGAMAATGVAAGCASPAGAGGTPSQDPTVQCAVKPAYCGTFHDDGAAPTWTIDASTLQILWGEVFPRLVGWAWSQGWVNPFPRSDLTHTLNSYLILYRDWLLSSSAPPPYEGWAPPAPTIAAFEATRFGGRFKQVMDYFSRSRGVMPVRYHGPGAFDFIISDFGLDLFAPPGPPNQTELLRFYEYRGTGQATLGLPAYLDQATARAFDVQSPTGPSQVWTDAGGMGMVINPAGCTLGALQCLDDPGQPYPGPQGPRPDPFPPPDTSSSDTIVSDTVRTGRTPFDTLSPVSTRDPDLIARAKTLFLPFQAVRNFTVEGYFAAVSRLRCWQLEGSVYRGIVQQLPRVVATVWREQLMGCTGEGSYAEKFHDPKRMRQIFADRLESRLPLYADMVFEVGPRPGQDHLTDIEVSNQGLRFPDPGAAPALGRMFSAIGRGRAGNPVFTDSKRPDGDE